MEIRKPRDGGPNQAPTSGAHGGVDDLLAAARARLDRVPPERLASERDAGALIVDIRPAEQRARDGDLVGAVVVERNTLEWRLDPLSDHRIPEVSGHDDRIVLVCNEGYGSSLAAATLHDIGLHRATDLIGGFQAWLALGHDQDHAAAGGHLVVTDRGVPEALIVPVPGERQLERGVEDGWVRPAIRSGTLPPVRRVTSITRVLDPLAEDREVGST